MADLTPTDPEELWQQYLSSLPESFSVLVNTDLQVGEAKFSVHQDLLCLHSEVFSDLLANCSTKGEASRPIVPLHDDSPDDAVRYLRLLYQQTRSNNTSSAKLTSASQTVRIARFAHKYAAKQQAEACDEFLYKKAGETHSGEEAIESWGPLQWIDFAERHDLRKTLAAWECWAICNFKDLKQDVLNTPKKISFRSLSRICNSLYETSSTARLPPTAQYDRCANCGRGCSVCSSYDPSYCTQCGFCKTCFQQCSTLANGKTGCATHALTSTSQPSAPASITMETLLSWQ